MPVVVTGAAGFIGQHTVAALVAAGHDVVGVDRRETPGCTTALRHDLVTRHDHVRTALREADAVIHLAGRPGVRDAAADIEERRWHDNVLAGEAVLADTPLDTPLVVASSSSVYGGARRGPDGWLACTEDQPLAPRGGYARSKVVLEERCAVRRDAGGRVVVVRPFTVAGEGQRPDMALSTWIAQARAGRPFTVLGSVDRRRDVTDVRDVVAGLLAATALTTSTTINLGTGTTHSLAAMTRAVADVLDVPHRIDLRDASAAEVPVTRAATDRCRDLLGVTPTTDLHDLVRRQADAGTTTPLPTPLQEAA